MDKILYIVHIMWYEYKIVNEMLDSLKIAIDNSTLQVDIMVCLNGQTYIENPEPGIDHYKLFDEFLDHPVLENATIISKNMDTSFYNIGDWRRDIYGKNYDYKYTVWGESDCFVIEDYFHLLNHINISEPHIVSFAARQMWDNTWHELEHPYIHEWEKEHGDITIHKPLSCGHKITYEQITEFNRKYSAELYKLQQVKLDGSMTALSRGLPYPFIPPDLHFASEDYCAQQFFSYNNIPQYHGATKLRGHNRSHPDKRLLTDNTRDDDIYKRYHSESVASMQRFLSNLK